MSELTVRWDGEAVAARLGAVLDGLERALGRGSWREALGEDALGRALGGLDGVRARLGRPFCLLVAGDFKRGKSTLINAMLGRELVTMDVTPETVAITELHHGPELRVEARLVGGGKVALRPEDLPGPRLTTVLQNLPAELDHVRVEAPVPWLRDVMIVDSPGTGDLLWRFDRRVAAYMPRADAIVYVVSALSPLSDTERGFLELALRPLDLGKVLFVVNRADSVPGAADAARLVRRVADGIHAGFPDAPVFGLSALHELCRQTGEPLPLPAREAELTAAFAAFRDHLGEVVRLERDALRGERAIHEAVAVVDRAVGDAGAQRAALELDRGALRDRLDEGAAAAERLRAEAATRESAVRAEIGRLADEAAGWLRGLLGRLEEACWPALESMPHDRVQRHFPFFLASTVRDGVAAALDAHQGALLALAEQLSAADGAALDAALAERALRSAADRASFQTPQWTFFDHLHVVGLLLGAVTGVVAPLLAGLADKGMAQEARAAQYRQRLRAAMPELETGVTEAVRKTYAEIGEQILARAAAARDAELAAAEQRTRAALAAHDLGAARIAEATETLDAIVARLRAARAELGALAAELGVRAPGA